MRRLGLFLIVASTMFGASTAAASARAALPEFKTCVKVGAGKGKYASSSCNKTGGAGSWERSAAAGVPLTAKLGATNLYFYSPSNPAEPWAGGVVEDQVTCKKGKAAGHFTGPKTLEITLNWSACAERSNEACASAGGSAGSIKSMPLAGTLEYLNSATPTVGVMLEPKSGVAVTEFKCFFPGGGVSEWKIFGAVIGQLEGIVNKASKRSSLAFRANPTTGAQEWTGFNGTAGSFYLRDEVSSPVCHPCTSPVGFGMPAKVKSGDIMAEA